ncbi:hypothetical protein [Catellatospora citrea]|uniref:Uncharacterized protein n=1 Tax=Catellatospora citrea TaxID=53366 RepID=A0A8J3K4K0_9ACTN|nr:hypothetical protein [Catellatospora citrea]RKE11142.1 hypothetical protein C8E86_6065 [Catellatospora citrea]GIF96606.1 hypothetical protein Cci01nite_17000 [Catellatospora citrea]
MAKVLLIHGINNTYRSAPQLTKLWVPALSGGVGLADAGAAIAESDVACVFFGDLFRAQGRFLGDGIPHLTEDDVTEGPESDLLFDWWSAAAEIDQLVVHPDAHTLGMRSKVKRALLALSGSKFLAGISTGMLVWWLKQVTLYFTDADVRAAVQKRLGDAIGEDTRVIVAHSLGSVAAYEVLCAGNGRQVTDLVTLGSPLGVPNVVFDRLTPRPQVKDGRHRGMWPGVERWVNIVDVDDFVALRSKLATVFGDGVTDVSIDNGLSAHAAERYLSAAETGAAVLAGLRNPE